MKKKFFLLIAFLILTLPAQGENEVEIDLNSNTLISTEGLKVNYGNMELNILKGRRDEANSMLYLEDKFTGKIFNPNGRFYISSLGGDIDLEGKNGNFQKSYGYLEVGTITGAEYPNNKVFFGADEIVYKNENILMENAWVTTDSKVNETENPEKAGYYLLSKEVYIEPDKQITLKKVDFYKGEKGYLPFDFPWYRANIRNRSKVPLFPTFGTQDEYGWHISTGVLYGNQKDKFVGGFAPKFGDQMGLLVGNWENWYKTESYGQSKLNITDWLVSKKNEADNRHHFNLLHNYAGEYGELEFDILNSTFNMVPGLKNTIKDFNGTNAWQGLGIDPLLAGDNMNFYSFNSSLSGMGERKDITLDTRLKRVSNKTAYETMVFDFVDDGSSENYELYSDVSLYKENEDYKIGGYYNYLDVINPGNSSSQLKSKEESFGFVLNDKNKKIDLTYDKITGDSYRELTFIESNSSLKASELPALKGSIMEYADYELKAIPHYDTDNSENFNLKLGEYSLNKTWNFLTGYAFDAKEKELSLIKDSFRIRSLNQSGSNNLRDGQFNSYENIIYEKTSENRGYVKFLNPSYSIELGGGNFKEIYHDREGIYNENLILGTGYTKYENQGEFADFQLEKNSFPTVLGNLKLVGGLRYNQYSKSEINNLELINGKDSSLREQLKLEQNLNLYEVKDKTLDNNLELFYQNYSNKSLRLQHNSDIKSVTEELIYKDGDLSKVYTGEFILEDKASTGKKENQYFSHKIDWDVNKEINTSVYYNSNSRYSDKNMLEENHKDLTYENYGGNVQYLSSSFNYNSRNLKSSIYEILNIDNSKEKISENSYSYSYSFKDGDRIGLGYTEAKDIRDLTENSKREIDIRKKLYTVAYKDFGEVYDHNYSLGYGRSDYKLLPNDTTDEIRLGYSFLDKSTDPEFLKEYAAREYLVDPNEVSSEQLNKVAMLMKERAERGSSSSSKFDLNSFWRRPVAFTGEYNRKFSINTWLERDKSRYKETDDILKSLKNWEVATAYSQRRIGIGYNYREESGYRNGDWERVKREQILSLNAKIGKPSEGYRVTTYGKRENEYYFQNVKNATTLGVELGKEMGYYEWSIAYLREFTYNSSNPEWKIALQFTLLTFPDKPIFGFGTGQSSNNNKSLNTDIYFFDGIKASDLQED